MSEQEKQEKRKGEKQAKTSRRDFIKYAGAALAVAASSRVVAGDKVKAAGVPVARLPLAPAAPASGTVDVLIRMQQELATALKKPVAERHWHMVLDLRKCVGCSACTIGCVAENKLPPGVVYRPVLQEESGTYPNVRRLFTPRPCMHCDKPPCTQVCPVNATWKQADGAVVVDYERCIGCRYCMTACPYSARVFDFGDLYTGGTAEADKIVIGAKQASGYERQTNYEYAKRWPRTDSRSSPIGNVRKCHFCLHRVENGMLPACVTTCIGRATFFGDANDPASLVSELAVRPNVMRLKEELGTEPSVFYLV